MRVERVEKLADMLVNYSVAVKPGDKVAIEGSTLAEPLLKEIYKSVLIAGGQPLVLPYFSSFKEIKYKFASDEQLSFVYEHEKMLVETYDVFVYILAEENTKGLNDVDARKISLAQQSRNEATKIHLQRAAQKEMRWTLTLFPTNAYAQDAKMSLSDYEDFVYNACMPDMNNPVAYWEAVDKKQQRIVDWLDRKKQVHVTGLETDLCLSIEGRKFISCACHENVPDGEIFTGPVENSIEGKVYFSYPAIFNGHEVTGIRLWFDQGKVIKASAEKNEDFLLKMLDTDDGSRGVGEFAIGTNKGITKFTGAILFDEKIGGSFHIALGLGYPETGSLAESSIHWDMICDLREGGKIVVDDQVLYQNGDFVI